MDKKNQQKAQVASNPAVHNPTVYDPTVQNPMVQNPRLHNQMAQGQMDFNPVVMGGPPVTRNFHLPKDHPSYEKFLEVYPAGLPWGMTLVPTEDGVPRQYIEDNIPSDFYLAAPETARAVISTDNGKRPFRYTIHAVYQRKMDILGAREMQMMQNAIRLKHWDDVKHMAPLTVWEDLWHYFDARDLYVFGAQNLWNLVQQMVLENVLIFGSAWASSQFGIGMWANEWLKNPVNLAKIKAWDRETDIFSLFSGEDMIFVNRLMGHEPRWVKEALIWRIHLPYVPIDGADQGTGTIPMPASGAWHEYGKTTLHLWLGT